MSAVMEVETKPEINYRACGNLRFGSKKRESVMPRWWVEQCGVSAEKLVRDGHLEETSDPVVEDFRAPETKATSTDPGPAMAEEMNALRAENSRLRAENKGLAANNETLRAKEASQTVALGEQTASITHWRKQFEAAREATIVAEKKIADLQSELTMNEATKPTTVPADPRKIPTTTTKTK